MRLFLHVIISYFFCPNNVSANQTQDNITLSPTVGQSVNPVTIQPAVDSIISQETINTIIFAVLIIFCGCFLLICLPLGIRHMFRDDEENNYSNNATGINFNPSRNNRITNNSEDINPNSNTRRYANSDEKVHYGRDSDDEEDNGQNSSLRPARFIPAKRLKRAYGSSSPYRTPKHQPGLRSIKEGISNDGTEEDDVKEKTSFKKMDLTNS